MSSAKRLHQIYARLLSQDVQKRGTMVEAWASVFGLSKTSPDIEDEVAGLVMALRSEIKLVRGWLDGEGAPGNLTSPGFERLFEAASTGHLRTSWSQLRSSLETPDCRKVFEWVEWVQRDAEDGQISGQELQSLRSELESLEQALGKADMASSLRYFIQRQVDTIRRALRLYAVQGPKPIEDALEKVAGAFHAQEVPLKSAYEAASPDAKNLMNRATDLVSKVARVSDDLVKIKKASSEAVTFAGTVAALVLPYVR